MSVDSWYEMACRAHNMTLKQTKEPVTPIACAIAAPEPLGCLTWCYVARKRRPSRTSKRHPALVLLDEFDRLARLANRSTCAVLFVLLCASCNSVQVDEVAAETEAAIAQRVSSYIRVLTEVRDAEAAADYYTQDARLIGPGTDQNRASIVEGLREAFRSGMQVRVNRRTLEIYVYGDAAYEIAQAEDTIISLDGSSVTMRNNMFIRWEKGNDGQWRFDRVLLSPQGSSGQR